MNSNLVDAARELWEEYIQEYNTGVLSVTMDTVGIATSAYEVRIHLTKDAFYEWVLKNDKADQVKKSTKLTNTEEEYIQFSVFEPHVEVFYVD